MNFKEPSFKLVDIQIDLHSRISILQKQAHPNSTLLTIKGLTQPSLNIIHNYEEWHTRASKSFIVMKLKELAHPSFKVVDS